MKKYNGEKLIVSLTSFGERFKYAAMAIKHFMDNQSYKDFHLVLTVYKVDLEQLSDGIKYLLSNDKIELIVGDENLCPHLKYFYAMLKYHDLPIVTIDDDRVYSSNMLAKLVEKYQNSKIRGVISNCAPVFSFKNGIIEDRNAWCVPWRRLLPNCISYLAMAEGFAGVLYPPNAFENLIDEIPEIKKYLYDDDIFLRALETKNCLPVIQANSMQDVDVKSIDIEEAQQFNLEKHNNADMGYRKQVTRNLNDILLKGFYM